MASLEEATYSRRLYIQKKATVDVEKLIEETSESLRGIWDTAISDVLTEAANYLSINGLDRITINDIDVLSSMLDESLGEGLISSEQYKRMKDLMQASYMKGATEAAEGSGVSLKWGESDQKSLNTLALNARYWINSYFDDEVQAGIDNVLRDHFTGGSNRKKVALALKDHFNERINKDDNYWDLLADHTMTKTLEVGRVSGYEQAGIDYVKINAVIDEKTSKICHIMNGRVIPVNSLRGHVNNYLAACETGNKDKIKESWPWTSDKKAESYEKYSTKQLVSSGISLPPYHGRCRTITNSYFGEVPDGTPEIVKPKPEKKPRQKKVPSEKEKEEKSKEYEQAKKERAEAKAKIAQEKAKAKKAAEEKAAKERAEKEAKEKAEQKAKIKAELEAKKKAEEKAKAEAKRKAELEAKEAKRKAELEAKKKAEEEAKRQAEKKAREEARRKAELEAKRKAELEAKRKAEEAARKKAEEKAKKEAEQEEKRKAAKEGKKKIIPQVEHGKKVLESYKKLISDAIAAGHAEDSPYVKLLKKHEKDNIDRMDLLLSLDNKAVSKNYSEAMKSKLYSRDDAEVISSFTSSGYGQIREAQSRRFKGIPQSNFDKRYTRDGDILENLIENNIQYEGELYRGIKVKQDVYDKIMSLDEIDFGGQTSSTSVNLDIAVSFASATSGRKSIIFKIIDGRGLPIQDMSSIEDESEVLVSGKSKFKVVRRSILERYGNFYDLIEMRRI